MLCPLGLRGQGVNLIAYPHLAPSLETCGAIPPLSVLTITRKENV